MNSRVLTISVVVLIVFSIFNLSLSVKSNERYESLRESIDAKTNKTIVYNGKDGRNGSNGVDGINAVSFSVTQLTIKEVPLVGKDGLDGKNGVDAPVQQLRVNPDTKDIENRLSSDKYWGTLVVCSEYRIECPSGN